MKRNFLYGIGIALSAITPHITALEQVLPDLLFIDNQTNEPVIIQVTQGNKLILRDGILAPAKNVSRVSAYQHTTSPSPRAGAIHNSVTIQPHSAPEIQIPLVNATTLITLTKNNTDDRVIASSKEVKIEQIPQIRKRSIPSEIESKFIVENSLNNPISVSTRSSQNKNIQGDSNIFILPQSKIGLRVAPIISPGSQTIKQGKFWYWKNVDRDKRALMSGYIDTLEIKMNGKPMLRIPIENTTKKIRISSQGEKLNFIVNPPELAPGIIGNRPR